MCMMRTANKILILFLFVLLLPANTAKAKSKVLIPKAEGRDVLEEENVSIDLSNTGEGYLIAEYSGEADDIYVQLTGSDGVAYKYFVTPGEKMAAIPFTSGSGSYELLVYEHIDGDQYAMLLGKTIEVALSDEFLPFLYSNQYVHFTADDKAVKKAEELVGDGKDDLESLKKIYYFVIDNITYDEEKAKNVETGYLPDIDETLETKKGICFDYAALMAGMLRSQGIPTMLDIGYTGGDIYHAWISTWLDEHGWVDVIEFDGKSWKLMDPTFASCDGNSDAIQDYIGDGDNYIVRYRR